MLSYLFACAVATAVHAHAVPPSASATRAHSCVTTSVTTQTMLPTPPYWPVCSFDGTARIYPSVVTATSSVDCHGCDEIWVRVEPAVFCPNMPITATHTESTALTVTRTSCASSVTP